MASPPPTRHATIAETYTEHEWWLLAWAGGDPAADCRLPANQDGTATPQSSAADCLPPLSASLALEGCTQTNFETVCPLLPSLLITGAEPLPDYLITQIHYESSLLSTSGGEGLGVRGVCEGRSARCR